MTKVEEHSKIQIPAKRFRFDKYNFENHKSSYEEVCCYEVLKHVRNSSMTFYAFHVCITNRRNMSQIGKFEIARYVDTEGQQL